MKKRKTDWFIVVGIFSSMLGMVAEAASGRVPFWQATTAFWMYLYWRDAEEDAQ